MATKRTQPQHLVIPQEQDWPVLGCEADGSLILDEGFVEGVEQLNALPEGSLEHGQVVTLLLAWYEERRRIGFPVDPVMEQVTRAYHAA
jgi:hypothetical protein